ncbi:MAG: 4a-hydroxytetrahydrobiopterin dehydratase [Deltaproteobacteria bacterium]|nr:4a-hydroxytetrahydrobiopterin dehydratase [Deltaproteobacteria bacterium]
MRLSDENCHRIEKSEKPVQEEEAKRLVHEVPEWHLKDGTIEKDYRFGGFTEAIDFVNRVADIAQSQDHHPDICVSYNKVHLELSTHKVGGLTRNDFILAAKIDTLGKPH